MLVSGEGVWNMKYLKSPLKLHNFIARVGCRPLGLSLPRPAWIILSRLRTGIGRFPSPMHKSGSAPSCNCECGAHEQTADLIIHAYPKHRAPKKRRGLSILYDHTRCWFKNLTAII